LDHIASDAKLMGAVNTIYLKDGETYGENTDGKGFMVSLKEGKVEVKGKKVVVLVAGGAARSITVELALAGVAHIIVVNVNRTRGEALVSLLNDHTPVKAEYVLWDDTYKIPEGTDLVVNATSIGLYPDTNKANIDYGTLSSEMVVCDIIPNPPQTAFLDEADKVGCHTLDGFSMLVNQGAISFKMWVNEEAPIEIMRKALMKEFEIESN
jgi:shikimate dehydrogenase